MKMKWDVGCVWVKSKTEPGPAVARRLFRVAFAAGLLGAGLAAGCAGDTVDLEVMEDEAILTRNEPGDGAFGPYGYCSAGNWDETEYPDDCPGLGARMWGAADECGSCQCLVDCGKTSDCPTPESGTSEPVCVAGHCNLPCDDGQECPDGMSCVAHDSEGRICAWEATAETDLGCALYMDERACEQFTTKESCEERLENAEAAPQVACLWGTEAIHSTGDDSCTPAAAEEKCIAAVRYNDGEETSINRCSGQSIFWRDLGAGTAALVSLERRDFYPSDEYGNEPCELGDPSIPLLCDCACE